MEPLKLFPETQSAVGAQKCFTPYPCEISWKFTESSGIKPEPGSIAVLLIGVDGSLIPIFIRSRRLLPVNFRIVRHSPSHIGYDPEEFLKDVLNVKATDRAADVSSMLQGRNTGKAA